MQLKASPDETDKMKTMGARRHPVAGCQIFITHLTEKSITLPPNKLAHQGMQLFEVAASVKL